MLRHRLASGLAAAALLLTASACDSTEADGPLAEALANAGAWTWVEVEGSQCRDGSPTGIGVRLQEGATDLAIYLEGGGACFNAATCAGNPSSFGAAEFGALAAAGGSVGMFDTASASNPVAGYNMVYVPYCTGDVHAGSFPQNTLLASQGVTGPQQFVGHQNVRRAVSLLAEGLDTPAKVLLAGSSAGGLGALINFDYTARTFAESDLFLVNDSGPIVYADNVLSPALGAQLVGLFNVSVAVQEAPQLFGADGLEDIYNLYATRYPDAHFGFSSHLGDDVFQYFFGFGQPAPISDEAFAAGLRDLRSQIDARWGTYYKPGDAHTFLLTPDRYTGTTAGVSYEAWLATVLAGNPTRVDGGASARQPLAAR